MRMTLAATLMMLCIMIFRLPGAALGAYYSLLISRDNPNATLDGVVTLLTGIGLGLADVLAGGILFSGSPLLHFLWLIASLFAIFFLISAATQYGLATSFGFIITSTIPIWDFPARTNIALENTLYAALAVAVGATITVVIELVFAEIHSVDLIQDGVNDRLRVVAEFLKNVKSPPQDIKDKLEQYADIGTGYLRRLLARSEGGQEDHARKSVPIALTGRLVDLAAGLMASSTPLGENDQSRFTEIAGHVDQIREFGALSSSKQHHPAPFHPAGAGFQQLLQATVELFDEALQQPALATAYIAKEELPAKRLLKRDAFINAAHLKFALRGTAAALICYLMYHLLDWRGLYNSVATCMVTALSTTGSSRQKQILRICGAITGGLFLAIAAEVFVLPHMDSITEFLLLFTVVTAAAAWIATSSPRISYFGLQMAFAFYVVHLRTFAPDIQLAPARDNVAGILLGLVVMWIVFDQLAPHDSVVAMKASFVQAIRLIAAYIRERQVASKEQYLKRVRRLRDSINDSFADVRNNADAVLLEFGSNRSYALKWRTDVRAWQPELRTLFLLQITLAQMRLREPTGSLPAAVESSQDECVRLLEDAASLVEHGVLTNAGGDNKTFITYDESDHTPEQRSAADALAEDSLTIVRDLFAQLQSALKN